MRSVKTAPKGWIQFIKTLACDSKLNVVIGHNVGAATNGKTMWLPALPLELNEDDLVLFKGNAFHEVGHIRCSDLPLFQAFSKKHGSFAQFLLNALEDVFMEGRMAAWKKMAARYLLDSNMVLIERGQFRNGEASFGEAIACFCYAHLTAMRWPKLESMTQIVEANLRKHLAQHADVVVPALIDLIDDKFPACKSTKDCCDLTLAIIKLLNDLAEQEQSNSNSDSKDEDEQVAEGDGADQNESNDSEEEGGESKDKPTSDDDEKGSEDESEEAGKADESKDDGSNGGSGKPDEKQEGTEDDTKSPNGSSDQSDESQEGVENEEQGQGKTLKEMVDDLSNENLGDQEVVDKGKAISELAEACEAGLIEEYQDQPLVDGLVIDESDSNNNAHGKGEDYVDGLPVVQADRDMANALSAVTSRKARVQGNRLRALLANREEAETFTTRHGSLSVKHLYRVGLDDTRIFEKSEETVTPTAAVSITADLSGSTMFGQVGGSVAEQIRIALTVLENVLHEIGTPREILGFAPQQGNLGCMVKSFDDNHRVALDRIAGLHSYVGGGDTPIAEAVMQAGFRLMTHESERKLLLVVTDGLPNCTKAAIQMTEAMRKAGVEVIYLVIAPIKNCEWLAKAGIKHVQSSDAEGLLPALVSKVADFLA